MKISIIVPVYNGENFIDRCIKSILNQTFFDYEVIIIDDGSTDNSLNIINSLVSDDNRFSVYSIKNSGVSNARNIGIEKANGKYLFFLDSDDYLDENALSNLYNNSNGADLVFAGYKMITRENNFIKGIPEDISLENVYDYLFTFKINNAVWGKLFKKKIITDNKIVFFESISYGEDLLFLINFLGCATMISSSFDNCYNYYVNESGVTCKYSDKMLTYIDAYKNILLLLNEKNLKNYKASSCGTFSYILYKIHYSNISKESKTKKQKIIKSFLKENLIYCNRNNSKIKSRIIYRVMSISIKLGSYIYKILKK